MDCVNPQERVISLVYVDETLCYSPTKMRNW